MSNAPAAFRATYADWKLIKTRSVIQVVFEVPLADHDAAYAALGGMPDPATERWFAIARLKKEVMPAEQRISPTTDTSPRPVAARPDGVRKPAAKPLAQRLGILANEGAFRRYLKERHWLDVTEPAVCIRAMCGVKSRADIDGNPEAELKARALLLDYSSWVRAVEIVG